MMTQQKTHSLSRSLSLLSVLPLLFLTAVPASADDPSDRERRTVKDRQERNEERSDRGRREARGNRDEARERRDQDSGRPELRKNNWLDQAVDQHRRRSNDSWRDRDRERHGERDRWQSRGDRDRWQSHGDRDRWQSHGDRDRWQSHGDRDRWYGDRDRWHGDRDRWHGDRDRWYGDRHRGNNHRYERRHYSYSSRPWYGCDVRDGFYLRFGSFAGWSFQIPRVLVIDTYDRYDEYYWGEVSYHGGYYDVYLFPAYHGNRVEYVPYAYRDGRLHGRGRLLNSGPNLQVILDF